MTGRGKLRLKGEKSKAQGTTKRLAFDIAKVEEDEVREGWDVVEIVSELNGYLIFVSLLEDIPSMITVSEESALAVQKCEFLGLNSELDKLEPLEPTQFLIGRSHLPGIYCLKTAYGKYISSDSKGRVYATREAVGASEGWEVIKLDIKEISWVFVSKATGMILTVEEGGLKTVKSGGMYSEGQKFHLRCQAATKPTLKAKAFKEERIIGDLAQLEATEAKRFQSYSFSKTTKRDLEMAEEEGRLRERLVERRVKTKHDPFC